MSPPRLTPATMDAELYVFLRQLTATTRIDAYVFADWIRANITDLRERFDHCDEPVDTDRRVENCQGIWLRCQFKARVVTV